MQDRQQEVQTKTPPPSTPATPMQNKTVHLFVIMCSKTVVIGTPEQNLLSSGQGNDQATDV
jgi:hypothetical protein